MVVELNVAIEAAPQEVLAQMELAIAERDRAVAITGRGVLDELRSRGSLPPESERGDQRGAEHGEDRSTVRHRVFRYSTSARRSASVSTFVHSWPTFFFDGRFVLKILRFSTPC